MEPRATSICPAFTHCDPRGVNTSTSPARTWISVSPLSLTEIRYVPTFDGRTEILGVSISTLTFVLVYVLFVVVILPSSFLYGHHVSVARFISNVPPMNII